MSVSPLSEKSASLEVLSCGINWDDDPTDSFPYHWKFQGPFGIYWLKVDKKEDKYYFAVIITGPRYSFMSQYKSCRIETQGGDKVLGTFPFVYDMFGTYRIDGSVSVNEAVTNGKENSLWFFFSTEAPVTGAAKPPPPAPTLADYMMEQLYKDTASQDVVFVVGEEAVGVETEAVVPSGEKPIQEASVDVIDLHPKGSESDEQVADQQDSEDKTDSENKESDDKKEMGDSRQSEGEERSEDKEGSDDQKTSDTVLSPDGATSIDSDSQNKPKDTEEKGKEAKQKGSVSETTVGAHKMVLSHWPFFKKMIKAADSDSSVMRLHISDMKQEVFRVLIRFLYTGRLPPGMEPKILFVDGTAKEEETSWEDLFLAADYCRIDELRQVALRPFCPS
ncbi:hypothetical protein BGZ74_006513 [Mortierella antarctica]|nr:hypothetical protein BGZ74_006513 [Mortierella antarctica]